MTTDAQNDATIWGALNDWGKSLPDWQRFIVSHAVRDGQLSDERVDEATRLFLRHSGLDEGTEELPSIPESVTGRQNSGAVAPLILKEMKSLKNVNAIPDTSSLKFGSGLTVIYGPNGAGKSGFARVLSAACFSRSEQEIIGNIYDETALDDPASAEILIDPGTGKAEAIAFSAGDENEALQRVSVFDSSVARIHLAQENTLGFQPTGFDVFDEVSRVMDLIGQKVDAAIAARTKPNNFGKLFVEPGPLAQEIDQLSATTDITKLRARCAFGETEQERLEEVARQEKEATAESPVDTLKTLETAKKDIEAIRTAISRLKPLLDDAACQTSRSMLDELKGATQAANKEGAEIVQHKDLKCTGTTEWDTFVEASRTLGHAEKDTYPEVGDPCLLCHRPLDEPSASLIRRMWGFLDGDARVAAQEANEKINHHLESLKALKTDLLPEGSRIRSDLSKAAPDLVSGLDAFSKILSARRDAIVGALDSGDREAVPSGDMTSPDALITQNVAAIEEQEKALKAGKFDEIIAKLKAEHIDLRQRQVLSKSIDDVADYVADMKWVAKANAQRRSSFNPRFLTEKQKALFKTLIEGAYKKHLEEECRKLDCALPIEFRARGSAGRTLRGLKAQGGYQPEKIFSEGEQRALALADFLTEVNLNPASAAVILDDPVTSLDHRRKRKIAQRLVSEAKTRQVIVFTHDLVFLTQLCGLANEESIDLVTHWVDRSEKVPGIVRLDESPANADAYKTPHRAEYFLAQAKKTAGQEKVDFIRIGAGALRTTLEEIILRDVFNGTIRRWDEHVRVNNLSGISWSEAVVDGIIELHGDLSRLIEGHSHSDEFSGEMPVADELSEMIDRAKELQKEAKKKRK